ncbi:tyrosine-type recombinase/integrase [Leucobacter denitrificans]|uniref:Tyrosine-type recombinase/integrase n=2 Tax=Leucobacter denitrificans TaxID=683042 RepID=A0A7G9S7T7_9MICO|nr:tyrosine-type recombinase/integrase [Leucobacter denitrificans]
MSALQDALTDYLELRHNLGYKLADAGRLLPRFVAWLEETEQASITIQNALTWCQLPEVPSESVVWSARMTAVRGFARYLSGIDQNTQVPPTGLLPSRQRWRAPFVFTAEDIAALMSQADTSLDPRLPAATYTTLIGLLATTGLRIGEAIRLTRMDVDLVGSSLLIRESKFGKTRHVPVEASTVAALRRYARQRDRFHPKPATNSFFVTITGKTLLYPVVQKTFRGLCVDAGIGVGVAKRPHLHAFRHTFAVMTLVGWYQNGVDVDAHLPYLSTYLGHRDPRFTYWYLSAAPELLALAADRLQQRNDGRAQS